jgi:ribonuclease HII
MKYPSLDEEKKLWKKGYKRVVCLDEVGRGAVAGPVVAAAVSLKKGLRLKIFDLKDSKKLSPKKREEIYNFIVKNPKIEWGIGKVSEKRIDKINILEATKLAMKKALKNLERKIKKQRFKKIDYLILDGNLKLDLLIPQKSIIKADEKVFSCALASVIAKVTRDRIMKKIAQKLPQYRFEKHKGYLTKSHLKLIKKYGPSTFHRKTFFPINVQIKSNFFKKTLC